VLEIGGTVDYVAGKRLRKPDYGMSISNELESFRLVSCVGL